MQCEELKSNTIGNLSPHTAIRWAPKVQNYNVGHCSSRQKLQEGRDWEHLDSYHRCISMPQCYTSARGRSSLLIEGWTQPRASDLDVENASAHRLMPWKVEGHQNLFTLLLLPTRRPAYWQRASQSQSKARKPRTRLSSSRPCTRSRSRCRCTRVASSSGKSP